MDLGSIPRAQNTSSVHLILQVGMPSSLAHPILFTCYLCEILIGHGPASSVHESCDLEPAAHVQAGSQSSRPCLFGCLQISQPPANILSNFTVCILLKRCSCSLNWILCVPLDGNLSKSEFRAAVEKELGQEKQNKQLKLFIGILLGFLILLGAIAV